MSQLQFYANNVTVIHALKLFNGKRGKNMPKNNMDNISGVTTTASSIRER